MKLENNLKVFAIRLRGDFHVRIFNCNKELSSIIEQLRKSTKNYLNLDYLISLDYSLSTFQGLVKNQLVNVNLYNNEEMNVSILEIKDNHIFSFEELKESQLFIDNLPLLMGAGIHDNLLIRRMMSQLN